MRTLNGILPQHAYTIPYQFTQPEMTDWLSSQLENVPLQTYLAYTAGTPAGIVVADGYAQILVWEDPSRNLHIIDVTNLSVAQQVNQAAYESPDSSIVQNTITEIQKLVRVTGTVLSWLPYVGVGVLALYLLPWLPRSR